MLHSGHIRTVAPCYLKVHVCELSVCVPLIFVSTCYTARITILPTRCRVRAGICILTFRSHTPISDAFFFSALRSATTSGRRGYFALTCCASCCTFWPAPRHAATSAHGIVSQPRGRRTAADGLGGSSRRAWRHQPHLQMTRQPQSSAATVQPPAGRSQQSGASGCTA